MNIFSTVLTHEMPASNCRTESEENKMVMQKITKNGEDYTVLTSESIRSALRETLAKYNLPMNRSRPILAEQAQPMVNFKESPNEDKYADDFLFGWMKADKKEPEKKITELSDKNSETDDQVTLDQVTLEQETEQETENKTKKTKKSKKDATITDAKQPKNIRRESLIRVNLGVSLTPYCFNQHLHQSPGSLDVDIHKTNSALLWKEIHYTAYQYAWALDINEAKIKPEWSKKLLQAIGELNHVGGNHSRQMFDSSPKSLIVRATSRLAPGFDLYGFNSDGSWKEMDRIGKDLPAKEFWMAGEIVRNGQVTNSDIHAFSSVSEMLEKLSIECFG
jgi:CRISPR-associated protein Cst2